MELVKLLVSNVWGGCQCSQTESFFEADNQIRKENPFYTDKTFNWYQVKRFLGLLRRVRNVCCPRPTGKMNTQHRYNILFSPRSLNYSRCKIICFSEHVTERVLLAKPQAPNSSSTRDSIIFNNVTAFGNNAISSTLPQPRVSDSWALNVERYISLYRLSVRKNLPQLSTTSSPVKRHNHISSLSQLPQNTKADYLEHSEDGPPWKTRGETTRE